MGRTRSIKSTNQTILQYLYSLVLGEDIHPIPTANTRTPNRGTKTNNKLDNIIRGRISASDVITIEKELDPAVALKMKTLRLQIMLTRLQISFLKTQTSRVCSIIGTYCRTYTTCLTYLIPMTDLESPWYSVKVATYGLMGLWND